MLCIKIVFTKDDIDDIDEISSYLFDKRAEYIKESAKDCTVFKIKAKDEELYEVCQYICHRPIKRKIEKKIKRCLMTSYDCFNSDECKLIINNVLKNDIIEELPGRMYIYLKVNNTINPAGFFDFMCKDISQYLADSVVEEAERILTMNDSNDFIDILKCFSHLSPDSADTVEISADSAGLRICDCYPQIGGCMTEYGSDDADVLSELIALNPRRILVRGKEDFLKNDMSSLISAVFDGRIEYQK